jgi:hypothetical protein
MVGRRAASRFRLSPPSLSSQGFYRNKDFAGTWTLLLDVFLEDSLLEDFLWLDSGDFVLGLPRPGLC